MHADSGRKFQIHSMTFCEFLFILFYQKKTPKNHPVWLLVFLHNACVLTDTLIFQRTSPISDYIRLRPNIRFLLAKFAIFYSQDWRLARPEWLSGPGISQQCFPCDFMLLSCWFPADLSTIYRKAGSNHTFIWIFILLFPLKEETNVKPVSDAALIRRFPDYIFQFHVKSRYNIGSGSWPMGQDRSLT